MKKYHYIIIAVCLPLLSILVSACEKEVRPDGVVSQGNKLVVNSLIWPQSEKIQVEVSKSKGILESYKNYSRGSSRDYTDTHNSGLGDFSDIVTDATVSIATGAKTKELTYNSKTHKYELETVQFPIVEGKTYKLTVVDGNHTATASCTVPKSIKEKKIEWADRLVSDTYVLTIEWDDIKNENNYYYLYSKYVLSDSDNSDPKSPEHDVRGDWGYKKAILITDREDGLDRLSVFYERTPSPYYLRDIKSRIVDLNFYSMDKNYYEYLEKLIQSGDNADSPFAEPIVFTSNIDGGLGLFAAYSKTEKIELFQ